MVTVRKQHQQPPGATVDVDAWVADIAGRTRLRDRALLRQAAVAVRDAERAMPAETRAASGIAGIFLTGLEMVEILADLRLDQEALLAAMLYRSVREGCLPAKEVRESYGDEVATLIDGVQRMAAISALATTDAPVLGQARAQIDNVRKMLVSLVDDVRLALIKLAERTCAIRAVKNAPEEKRLRVAREVFDIYAPLAHRLGIGQIKWELEDLSFRYLEPRDYQRIASLLHEKRLDRERYVEDVLERLRVALERMGIQASLSGRAKHIYSIWRKMKRKGIDFSQVYDVRALRILVPDVRDCYAVLGVVHSLWRHIPNEFDDYIARPKQNGYRSLHTAVIGPDGKTMEVQIRTHEMHEEAELGVCAHYIYKEARLATRGELYDQKVAWLRQVLEWQDELGDVSGLVDMLRSDIEEKRIYVFTPDGHVVDLALSSTPVDFAYHIHTEVGHTCRGARVNGQMVPLNTALKTGDQVEILTGRKGGPSRDWLNPNLGYVCTSRARAKIQHWFKQQDRDRNIEAGRDMLEAELRRLALGKVDLGGIPARVNLTSVEDVYSALGGGDLRLSQVIQAISQSGQRTDSGPAWQRPAQPAHTPQGDVLIRGVGQLMSQIAGCCKPVPGDAISGYITHGRGVTVHRVDCTNLLQALEDEPERIIEVSWGYGVEQTYPVDLEISAWDRQGLLRDILAVVANEKVNVRSLNSDNVDDANRVRIHLTADLQDLQGLGRLLDRLRQVRHVTDVVRRRT